MKTFIEIGSCDFDTNIPLIETGNWKGIMIEPSPHYFESLSKIVETIKHKENLTLDNHVISDYEGDIKFLTSVTNKALWVRGLSSVSEDNHKGERLFDLKDNKQFIDKELKLKCTTLDKIIDKYEIDKIDYLKMDVEGHELNIIDSYSWSIMPDIIKLEHTHIDDISVRRMLEQKGYIVYTEHRDIYAIR